MGEFTGSRYDSRRDVTEVASLVRKYIRENLRGMKFSVKCHKYSMGCTLYVTYTGDESLIFKPVEEVHDMLRDWLRFGHLQTAIYEDLSNEDDAEEYVEDAYRIVCDCRITGRCVGREFMASMMMKDGVYEKIVALNDYVESFHREESDAMIDYFDSNFHFFGIKFE